MGLYDHQTKREALDLRFLAAIHGINLDDTQSDSSRETEKNVEKAVPLFGDPDSYNHLSQEEREELTQKMMGKHKVWARQAPGLGAK